jgi:hypothetical protein
VSLQTTRSDGEGADNCCSFAQLSCAAPHTRNFQLFFIFNIFTSGEIGGRCFYTASSPAFAITPTWG